VGKHPKSEPDQKVWQDCENIDGGCERENPKDQNDSIGWYLKPVPQQPQSSGSEKNARCVQKIVCGDKLAFFFSTASLLKERIERHNKNAAREAETCQC
jgi:hypothetical protein